LLDNPDLRVSVPFFDLLFPLDCTFHGLMDLIPDEIMDGVAFCKSVHRIGAMFVDPLDQVRGDAYVKGTVAAIGQHVNAGLFIHTFIVSIIKAIAQQSSFWLTVCYPRRKRMPVGAASCRDWEA